MLNREYMSCEYEDVEASIELSRESEDSRMDSAMCALSHFPTSKVREVAEANLLRGLPVYGHIHRGLWVLGAVS